MASSIIYYLGTNIVDAMRSVTGGQGRGVGMRKFYRVAVLIAMTAMAGLSFAGVASAASLAAVRRSGVASCALRLVGRLTTV